VTPASRYPEDLGRWREWNPLYPEISGKLRIGDDWNAIRIIALSQSNPLKAIAEFVENSIDAHAKAITITRGKEQGAHYLAIKDDGDGVPRDDNGMPDFKYVATHICDSIKRRLKADGNGSGLQGEFGIGLLSFWTVGDMLTMTSTGTDQKAYQMTMSKGDSRYEVSPKRLLFAEKGTELKISPLLDWTEAEVWAYIRARKLPYNPLHDRGYPSIGCAPCTRAVEPGAEHRAGRWWWETPESRECGLHPRRRPAAVG